jgi:hypothetical protein
MYTRIFIKSSNARSPCKLTLSPIMDEDTRLDVLIYSGHVPGFNIPALIQRTYETEITGTSNEIWYNFANPLSHRSYSRSLLSLFFVFDDKSKTRLSAILDFPMTFDMSSPSIPLTPSPISPAQQRVSLNLQSDQNIPLYFENLALAGKKDAMTLLYGTLFGIGAAMLAEVIASAIRGCSR